MNRRALNAETVIERLRTMTNLLDQLDRLRSAGLDRPDYGVRLQIERIMSALVDLAAAINTHVAVVELGAAPHDMTESFARAADVDLISRDLAEALAPSVSLRNVLVHAYLQLDVEQMLAAVPLGTDQYRQYIAEVARWVRERARP